GSPPPPRPLAPRPDSSPVGPRTQGSRSAGTAPSPGARGGPRRARVYPRGRARSSAPVCEHLVAVSRTTIIVLLAAGATVVGFLFASNAERLHSSQPNTAASRAASPQVAHLGWRETYGPPGQTVVFTVDSLTVTPTGWRAHVGISNSSSVAWELA